MHEAIINYINLHATSPLNESEIELVKNIFVPRRIRKRQYFLQEGDVARSMGFIVKGAMRKYSVDDKGVEHIVDFYIENWWAGDRESFTRLTPSVYNVEAWEDTDLLTLTKADSVELFSIPAIGELARKLDDNYSFASQNRINATISLSADQRYTAFAKNHPEFLQRFPQHMIASYLGVTKETLSRVRAQAVRN